ncbi:MAG: glutamate--tRNA ligase, partial [Pseudomonadota bacterium]
ALLSLLARLGSSDPVELRGSLEELAEHFEPARFGSAPTKFDQADLFPLTARVLHERPFEDVSGEIAGLGVPDDIAPQFWEVMRANVTTMADLAPWWEICRDGAEPIIAEEDAEFVREAMALLPDVPFDAETWSAWTSAVKDATGRKGKGLFMPLRLAVTGQARGPDMGSLMPLLHVVRAKG